MGQPIPTQAENYHQDTSFGPDSGFSLFMSLLLSGDPKSFDNAVSFWQQYVEPLVEIITDLTKAYTTLSEYWSGDAADAFYRDVARVQNYAIEILQAIAPNPAPQPPLIGPKLTGGAGSVAPVPPVDTIQQWPSGTAAMPPPPGKGSAAQPQIAASMIDVLKDSRQVVQNAHDTADNILSGNPIAAGAALFGGMEGQAWNDGGLTLVAFNAGLLEATAIGGPFGVGMMAGTIIGEAMNAQDDNISGADWNLKLLTGWCPAFSQVLYEHLTWKTGQPDGPATACRNLSTAWSCEAWALPNQPDPTQLPPLGANSPTGPGNNPGIGGGLPDPYKGTGLPPGTGGLGGLPTSGAGLGTGTGLKAPSFGADPFSSGLGKGAGLGSGLGSGLGATHLAGLGSGLGGAGDAGLGTGAGNGGLGGGTGAGAGAGGAGAGAGEGGASGLIGGMGGGRGGGKDDEENRWRTVYLPEDDDVWTGGARTDGPSVGGDF